MSHGIKITITFSQSTALELFKSWLKPQIATIKDDEWALSEELDLGENTYTLSIDVVHRKIVGEVFEKMVGCLNSGKGIWSKSYIVEDSLSDENRIAAFKVLSRIESEMRNVFTRALAQQNTHATFVIIDEEPDMTKKNRSLGPWYYAFTLNEYMQFLNAERAYNQHSNLNLGLIERIFDSENMSEAKEKIKELKRRKPFGELLFTDWESVRTYFANKQVANIRNRVCHFHPVTDADVFKLRELEKLVDRNIPKKQKSVQKGSSYDEFGSTLARLQESMSWLEKISNPSITHAFSEAIGVQSSLNSALSAYNKGSYFSTTLAAQKAAFDAIGGMNSGAQKAAFNAIGGIGATQKIAFDAINSNALEALRQAADLKTPKFHHDLFGLDSLKQIDEHNDTEPRENNDTADDADEGEERK